MKTRSRVSALAGVILILASAKAQAAPAGKAAEAEARRAAEVAKVAFERGNYSAALASFEQAYQLKQVPRLLFNIAQCHRQLGNHEKAVSFFQRFLETGPDAAQAKATRELIANERAKAAEADRLKREEAEVARKVELERAREAAAKAEADLKRASLEAALKQPPPSPVDTNPPVYKRWWFWGAVGVVVAGTTTAIVLSTAPRPTPTTFPDINAR